MTEDQILAALTIVSLLVLILVGMWLGEWVLNRLERRPPR